MSKHHEEVKSKFKMAAAVAEAFGFTVAESLIWVGLDGGLLQESKFQDMTAPQVYDLLKDMTGDQLKAAIDSLQDPSVKDTTMGEVLDTEMNYLENLEHAAKEAAHNQPTIDSFLSKLRNK
jgi:hypothetical protein